ncbi:MAG: hypothetical protein ABIP35_15320 [Ginsengibacter sp.]
MNNEKNFSRCTVPDYSIIRPITPPILVMLIGLFFGLSGPLKVSAQLQALPFEGDKTVWHDGFDRYDFIMDSATLTITPYKPPSEEKFGVREPAKGQRRCIVIVPKKVAPGNPWSWRGCYWDHRPQTEIELLRRGYYIAYISANANRTLKPGREWDAWYEFLTEKHGLSKRPSFVGMSRGGEYAYMWATSHPDKVSCLYVDNPAMNRETLMKLGNLAKNDVPLLHICGSLDPFLGDQTLFIESLYHHLGGRISLMIKDGYGHHPHSLTDPKPIADWIEDNTKSFIAAVPAFAGREFTRTNYYDIRNSYRYFPSDGSYIACRGPMFTDCYQRYEFNIEGIMGAVVVIAPNGEAPGKPWVYRAGFVDRNAEIDQALLAKGFYIVTGPVSFSYDSLQLKDWNATYQYFIDNGFSKKPVLEGAGGAAGEVYGWAINNPGNVSCIYAENPIMHTTFSRAQPIDHLELLAKSGVSLINVCGSEDPALAENTKIVEKRYKKFGGNMMVIMKQGVRHYPLDPEDTGRVVDFIVSSAR